ncbi:MAG: sodium ABC transporter ATP-binding protein [Pirellulaceae bacterium]|nr:MAG: sodium ABC transporter ATP-binding protein [Pirellulaceae bacterium]
MVEVEQLGKTYDDWARGPIQALRGVSFHALPGEIFGLLGPNGAGKTTLLRILGTLLRPSSGRARVNGYDVVVEPSQVRHHIGFVSANTAVYDRMTAWETVEYFGRLYGVERSQLRERMELLFRRLKMTDIRDVLGAKMSTGMKQKVSIARALVHDPPVLVFDEATSGLDVLAARALLATVRELRDQGKCIIFSTHVMREAEKLCDRVVILHRGSVLVEGRLNDLMQQFGESDLEELFFRLISDQEPQREADERGKVFAEGVAAG